MPTRLSLDLATTKCQSPGFNLAVCLVLIVIFLPVALVRAGTLITPAVPWPDREGMASLLQNWDLLLQTDPRSPGRALVRQGGPDDRIEPPLDVLRVDLFGDLLGMAGHRQRMFQDPVPAYRPLDDAGHPWRWRVQTGFWTEPAEGLTLFELVNVESRREDDPLARTPVYRQINASVEIPLALVQYRKDRWRLWAGRNWETWGPGWTGSLVLDSHHPAPDGFGAAWTADRWSARFRWGRLDDRQVQEQWYSRYLAAHRLDFSLGNRLRFGLSESALVTTQGATPWWSINPLIPYALAQQEDRNPEDSSDVFWSFDMVWNPAQKWALYGQFLLDDYMLDGPDRKIHPDQLGWLGGVIWTAPAATGSTWILTGEYSRLGSWTYVHRDPQTRYSAWNGTPGHPSGPDSETVTLAVCRLAKGGRLATLLWGRWHQHGDIALDTLETPVGSAGLPFPVPPVARWLQTGVQVRWRGWTRCRLEGSAGWTETRHTTPADPVTGQDPHGRGLWASLSLQISLGRVDLGL